MERGRGNRHRETDRETDGEAETHRQRDRKKNLTEKGINLCTLPILFSFLSYCWSVGFILNLQCVYKYKVHFSQLQKSSQKMFTDIKSFIYRKESSKENKCFRTNQLPLSLVSCQIVYRL